jgi:hypothetical protein
MEETSRDEQDPNQVGVNAVTSTSFVSEAEDKVFETIELTAGRRGRLVTVRGRRSSHHFVQAPPAEFSTVRTFAAKSRMENGFWMNCALSSSTPCRAIMSAV